MPSGLLASSISIYNDHNVYYGKINNAKNKRIIFDQVTNIVACNQLHIMFDAVATVPVQKMYQYVQEQKNVYSNFRIK